MKLIDLHVHSNISDGTLSPSDLALYAKDKRLSVIALTDHDTINGIEECTNKGKEIGLTVIPGIELAAEYTNIEIHILGYYIQPQSTALRQKLDSIIDNRKQRNIQMLDRLNNLGLTITEEDLRIGGPAKAVFTRAHFATALYQKGYVKTRSEAFDLYIGHGKPAYIRRTRPQTCIETIHAAGGLAVLAHPKLYGFESNQLNHLIKELTALGLDGIETFYPTHNEENIAELLILCESYGLFPTGGSDFHGSNKPGLDIGTGYGELKIPYEILLAMQSKLQST